MTVALTEIRHGEADGKVTVYAPGEDVSGLDEDTLKELEEAGVVGDPTPVPKEEADALTEENDELKAKVAELEAELAKAKQQKPSAGQN